MQPIAMLSDIRNTITATFYAAMGECPEHFLTSWVYPLHFTYTWGQFIDKVCYLPHFDLDVNMILEKLEALGLDDNTVIINDEGYRS